MGVVKLLAGAGVDDGARLILGKPERAWAAFSARPKISIVEVGLFTALLVPYKAFVAGIDEEK